MGGPLDVTRVSSSWALQLAGGLAKDAALMPWPMSQRKGLRSHETCSLRAEGLAAENTQRARPSLAHVSSQVSARSGRARRWWSFVRSPSG